MQYTTLIIAGVVALLIVATVIGLLSRYRKCPSDAILVVFGKAGRKKVTDPKTGKLVDAILPSKIFHGGGAFVWPVIQDHKTMSLRPLQMTETVTGLSSQNIRVTIPVTLTTAIGTTDTLMQNAASRFLTASRQDMQAQIKDILIGEVRSLMATMSIEEINSDRSKFLGKAKENIETELNKIGFEIININTADISDDASYIKNLGKKAATQASAQAEADIAEEEKKGAIKMANTQREREIEVATADKERETTVAKTQQEQAVQVAEITKDQEIRLAEANKDKATGVAEQEAQQVANVAKAQADAESKKAQAQAEQESNIAKSKASAEAAKAEADATIQEAEAKKQIRIAQAQQQQEAETIKATQEKEAQSAQYKADARKKSAEAEKQAGVAEQEATIAVSEAKGKAAKAAADADRVAGVSKVEAETAVRQTEQERLLKINEATARAEEARLDAEIIVPAKKQKEQAIIDAEAHKQQLILSAEADAEQIRKKAEADADRIRMTTTAEAEGIQKRLAAEAEGKRLSLMAEADKEVAIGMIPAQVVKAMQEAGMTPEMIVRYKTVDQLRGIAEAQAQAYEHIHLGEVTVYGNENTAGNFMTSVAESVMPMLKTAGPVKDALLGLFKKENEENKE